MEVIACDDNGNVYCLNSQGQHLWTFLTPKPVHTAATVADLEKTGQLSVIVTSGDHSLYVLNADGNLVGRYKEERRLIAPATVADIHNDGKMRLLFGGSGCKLNCISVAKSIPIEGDTTSAAQVQVLNTSKVEETYPLLEGGDFESTQALLADDEYPGDTDFAACKRMRPGGWRPDSILPVDDNWQRDQQEKFTGQASIKVIPVAVSFVLASEQIEIGPDLVAVEAEIMGRGGGAATAALRWTGLKGRLRQDPLTPSPADKNGWCRFWLDNAHPPTGAHWLQLICETRKSGDQPAWWDQATIIGHFLRPRQIEILVNQVGYDLEAPKCFTVQTNFLPINDNAVSGQLVDLSGTPVYLVLLEYRGRIKGAFGNDWGREYWRGDFTSFDTPGHYRLKVGIDGQTAVSHPFRLEPNLLWDQTHRPAYRFFYHQRCGMEIPGFHAACHLDDAVTPDGRQLALAGGWHDAGDCNTYVNAPYVFGLLRAYTSARSHFEQSAKDNDPPDGLLGEILWGADRVRRLIAPDGAGHGSITSGYGFWGPPELETDNLPSTGDERPVINYGGDHNDGDTSEHTAAMARISRYLPDPDIWIETAERGLKWAVQKGKSSPRQFSAAVDLYVLTQKQTYADLAQQWLPQTPDGMVEAIESMEAYDRLFNSDHTELLQSALTDKADRLLAVADNPFGICTFGPVENPNFFGTPVQPANSLGTNSHLLQAAITMGHAYRYRPDPRYLAFIYDQFNWILGNNPFNISLMEGQGSAFPPTYHHRYLFGGVDRGAVPGSIVNGIIWQGPGDDRPWFDMSEVDIPASSTNECWLPHNTNYLRALAVLKMIQFSSQTDTGPTGGEEVDRTP